jgi:hypothetical protein
LAVVAPTPIDALPTPPSTSDPANFDSRADAFLGALPDFGTEANALATNVFDNATDAATSAGTASTKATEAAASAASAVNAPGTSATSTTSLAVGSGSKSPTLAQTGKNFAIGQPVRVARTSDAAATWMQGIITDFDSGTGEMDVAVATFAGTGTYTDWTVSLTGPDALPAASAAEVQAGDESAKAVTPLALRQAAAFQTLTDAATVAWDGDLGFNARVTLGGNRTMGAPTNLHDGLTYTLEITQDGTGSRTLSWNAIFDWGDIGAPTLSTGAGKVDFAYGQYSSATGKLHMSFRKAAA